MENLPELRNRLAERLEAIEHAEDRLKEAGAALKAAEADYARAARSLTETPRVRARAWPSR